MPHKHLHTLNCLGMQRNKAWINKYQLAYLLMESKFCIRKAIIS